MNRIERLKFLKENKVKVLKDKKASIKTFGGFSASKQSALSVSKAENSTDSDEVINRDIVANTYYWMDSHDDVHVKGCFTKSISENVPFFLADHKFQVGARLGEVKSSEEKEIEWSELGIVKEGKTISLVHSVDIIKAYNEGVFAQYKNGAINQHSVGMIYVKVALAYDDPQDKEAYELFHRVLPMLGNVEEAKEQGYFYVVSEAKLRETSAVLMGSNSLTPTLVSEEVEQQIKNYIENGGDIDKIYNICKEIKNTSEDLEPSKDTLKTPKPNFFELLANQ